jgi:hypothetical protein
MYTTQMDIEVGTMWEGQGFIVEIISKEDKRNKTKNGDYIKNGDVTYIYQNGPVNKIGGFRNARNFVMLFSQCK